MYYNCAILCLRKGNVMNLEKNAPLYLQIKEELYRRIMEGEYRYDEMLPSEKTLVEQFGVSRVTIRKALDVLESEGMITRRAGFGTTINHDHSELKNFTMVKSFTNEMKESGAANTVTFSSTISIVFADSELMKRFHCEFSEKLYNLKRVRGSGDKAIVYSNTWLHLPIDLPTTKEFLFGSLYGYLIAENVVFSRFEEELEAMLPSRELREILKIEKDGAVLKRIRKGYDINNRLIEYTINYYDAKYYHYSVEVASIEKVR